MKIAVACKNGNKVSHFEFCNVFAIYDFSACAMRAENKSLVPAETSTSEALVALMRQLEVLMVLCDGMTPAAKNALLDQGIMPVTGYRGDADEGAAALVAGNIPITRSSCDNCGGNCSSGECHEEC